MNNGKILLSFRFASAMDHSAPSFLDIIDRLYRYHLHRFQLGTQWDRAKSFLPFFIQVSKLFFSFFLFFSNPARANLLVTVDRFRSIFEFPFGSSRKLKIREFSNDLVSPRERGGKEIRWKKRRKSAAYGIPPKSRHSSDIMRHRTPGRNRRWVNI